MVGKQIRKRCGIAGIVRSSGERGVAGREDGHAVCGIEGAGKICAAEKAAEGVETGGVDG